MQNTAQRWLQVDHLTIWRGEHCLISDLSFGVNAGELLHVRGVNGSGKTTLLRSLVGLTLPDEASISWFGEPARSRPAPEQLQKIRFIGHKPGIKDGLSIDENLSVLAGLRGESRDFDENLGRLGLANRQSQLGGQLSAGQRRRCILASLDQGDAVWILDEPFTSLDAEGIAVLTESIATHCARGGMVILTSHQDIDSRLAARELLLGAH